jgi:type IV pilus assembly protein PilQ
VWSFFLCRKKDDKEKRMARKWILGLILLMGLPLPLFAGQITDVKVGNKSQDGIEIIIEGTYGAYQGIGLRSPARFVIDLEKAAVSETVPAEIPVEGSIISEIKTAAQGENVRVVLMSRDSQRLFHCTMHDKEGQIVVKCWMPKEIAPEANTPNPAKTKKPAAASHAKLPQKDLNAIFGWPTEPEEVKEEPGEKTLAKYTGEKVTLDFYKTELHNVFRLFAEMSGKNFIIDEEVKGELTLSLKEVPWDSAMDLILELKGLMKEEKLGTTIIKPRPAKDTSGKGELVVKKFSEEILQPAKLLKQEKEDRSVAQALILEAHNLEAVGKKEDALNSYGKAYELWRDNLDLVLKSAYLNYTLGHYARCYFLAGQALKLNAKNSEAALYAALSAAKMNRSAEARHLFGVAIENRPQLPEAFFNYALFLKKENDYSGALSVYKRYEQFFGPSLEVWMAEADVYEMLGSPYEACNQYREIQKSGFPMTREVDSSVQEKIRNLCN